MRRVVIGLWCVAGVLVVIIGYRLLFGMPIDTGTESFPPLESTEVVQAPNGHAYRYIAAPSLTWDQAKAQAMRQRFKGQVGYLATIEDKAEFDFIMARVFPDATDANVTYLGGRQTAPNEWRWVTGPDASADGGKGLLFWTGNEFGHVADGRYADWMNTAFQHGSRWDTSKVCCVTLFSYRKRQFSTSLGNGFAEEGVAGYLVEFGA
ncbi:MAG TPA: hypothetical protein VK515_05210 [Rhizomicrobium sp.]|nr:hypothetical protein [Rhizomicrobium sp.]